MRRLVVALAGLTIAVVAIAARAERTLPDYRYFRALSIDVVGRAPTYEEIAAFERSVFDLDTWLDQQLATQRYAERIRRVYMDLLQLELPPSFQFTPPSIVLRSNTIIGPDQKPVRVFYRRGQRRRPLLTDGDFCFSSQELAATPSRITRELLDERTVVVKPWWLYADYRHPAPTDLFSPAWARRFPGFSPAPELLVEPDLKTPTTAIRVCREEAATSEFGAVYASGRSMARPSERPSAGRLSHPPGDSAFSRREKGNQVSCLTGTGFMSSVECGCGVGLERCAPGAGPNGNDPPAFVVPTAAPLGIDAAFETSIRGVSTWMQLWWSEEAKHFLDRIFVDDRDFREVLTSRATVVNGPLAQFYRSFAGSTCCGALVEFGYTGSQPLVQPRAMPEALIPVDTETWLSVNDRGPQSSGILTLPIFLTKYGSRRARAHALYSTFLCKDFVAASIRLEPSTEPDLTKRAGCNSCHRTLEPLAAYFARIAESDWTFLPRDQFPTSLPRCAKGDKMHSNCRSAYDPDFGKLRGSHVTPEHADAGPTALAANIVASPAFAPCVVQRVTESLLGRQLRAEDEAWQASLSQAFVAGGYRMRQLVRAVLTSPSYRLANDGKR